jgi:hypothetical protein
MGAASSGSASVRLTPAESRAMFEEINEVVRRWHEAGSPDPGRRPEDRPRDGRESVYVFYHIFPDTP